MSCRLFHHDAPWIFMVFHWSVPFGPDCAEGSGTPGARLLSDACLLKWQAGREASKIPAKKKTKTEGESQSRIITNHWRFFSVKMRCMSSKARTDCSVSPCGFQIWSTLNFKHSKHKSGDDSKSTRLPVVTNVKIAEGLGPALKQPNQWHSSLGGLETETVHDEEQKTWKNYSKLYKRNISSDPMTSHAANVPLSGPLDEPSPYVLHKVAVDWSGHFAKASWCLCHPSTLTLPVEKIWRFVDHFLLPGDLKDVKDVKEPSWCFFWSKVLQFSDLQEGFQLRQQFRTVAGKGL